MYIEERYFLYRDAFYYRRRYFLLMYIEESKNKIRKYYSPVAAAEAVGEEK